MERRLAAILAADVVGYSRLMDADEAATLAAINEVFDDLIEPLAHRQSGRIVKRMGDGVLIEFSSAVEALGFAIEMQRAMRDRNQPIDKAHQIEFRIGINIGDIIIQGDDIFGDGVNIAARLEERAEPGGILVSGQFHDAVARKTETELTPLGEAAFKNISRPIAIYSVAIDDMAGTKSTPADGAGHASEALPEGRQSRGIFLALAALVVIVAALVVGGVFWFAEPPPETAQQDIAETADAVAADKPSLVILPFDNLSGDEGQAYFSDGITEDLTTDISRISGLVVLARHTAFKFEGRGIDVRDIGRELGVDYVLEGSVRRVDNRVRINAQLIDAKTGGHIWANRFDREIENVFALQDDVAREIVAALTVKLTSGEEAELKHANAVDPRAYDLFLQGLQRFQRFTPEENRAARQLFAQAAELDPNFARAIGDIALSHGIDLLFSWSADPETAIAEAKKLSDRAVRIDPSVREVHFAMSSVNLSQKRLDEAIAATDRAILIDTNYADAYAQRAQALAYSGRSVEALASLEQAKRLNPLFPFYYTWIESLVRFVEADYGEAIRISRDVAERNPEFTGARLILAASYALTSDVDAAAWEVQEMLTLIPDLTLATVVDRAPFGRAEDRERYRDGLTKAGLK
ncbi:MAG: adenylate/guanylate cyclase domain-containing protein [Hyphomicrobiales bacterium]|nr:adenylate/guanylate cyclase domain-containing protein [Hyphomicrobiales bacterium]